MDGECFKMSVNWSETTKGRYSNNKKVGVWEKLVNSGYCVFTGSEIDKVTFPFVNDDYYLGKVSCKKSDYSVNLINGTYFSVDKGKVVD